MAAQGGGNTRGSAEQRCRDRSSRQLRSVENLTYVLTALPAEVVVNRLKLALGRRGPRIQNFTRAVLSAVFAEKDFPDQTRATCARCGRNFDPAAAYNHGAACKVDHDVVHTAEGVQCNAYVNSTRCKKCDREWDAVSNVSSCDEEDPGYCYEGPHVTELTSEEEKSDAESERESD